MALADMTVRNTKPQDRAYKLTDSNGPYPEISFSEARWPEFGFKRTLRTIPEKRQEIPGVKFSTRGAKMRTPHLVPLCKPAIVILEEIREINGEFDLVFTGDPNPRKPMSENTVNKALRNMGFDTKTDVCGHGFRTMACSAMIESGLWSVRD